MAGKHDAEKLKTLASVSTECRKLIGQAIIDGLISPGESAFSPVAADPDYNQGQGGYTQKGGDQKPGGVDYNPSPRLSNISELATTVIQTGQVVPTGDIAGGLKPRGGHQGGHRSY